MPAFIHERAKHILAKNPDMSTSMAFGLATQQSHALDKTPKDYGTAEGRRTAKRKFKKPKQMTRTANPGKLKTEKLAADVGSLTPAAEVVPVDYPLMPRAVRHAGNLQSAVRGEVLPDDEQYADDLAHRARQSIDTKGTGVGFSLGMLGTMLAPALMDAKRHPVATLGVQVGAPILGAGAGYLLRDRAIRQEGEKELPGAQHRWMARSMRKALSDRQDLGKNVDYSVEDQPGMSIGRMRAREGADGNPYPNMDYQFKVAFMDALPTLTGLATGYGPGRSVAGETAAAIAPKGRVERSENIARNAAVIGAPLGGLVAMGLARKYKLAPKLMGWTAKHFPEGLIAEPAVEQELAHLGVPGVAAVGGSLLGGGLTGAAVGALQRLRGPVQNDRDKVAAGPSPMWSRIGGAASKKPVWMAQSGFTPTGFKTPAQRLSKSMDMGVVDGSKGLKPLNFGKMQQQAAQAVTPRPTNALAENLKMGSAEETQAEPEKTPGGKLLFLGGAGAMYGAGSAMSHYLQKGMSAADQELAHKVRASSPVPIHDSAHGLGEYFESGWSKSDPPHIGARPTSSPAMLAHEMGHAELHGSPGGRLLQNKLTTVVGNLKVPLGYGLGQMTGGSEDERVRAAGLVGAGLLGAPQLATEGLASIRALRRLKGLGASAEQLTGARRGLAGALGTYAGGALMSVGAAIGGSNSARARAQRHEQATENMKMGMILLALTKTATGQEIPVRHEKEDAETGDETDPPIEKESAAADPDQAQSPHSNLVAAGAGIGSASLLSHAAPRITGRTALYHGTALENVPSILEKGLRPSTESGVEGVANMLPGEVGQKSKELAMLTPDKFQARMYADQAEKLQPVLRTTRDPLAVAVAAREIQQDPMHNLHGANPFANEGVLHASVPLWKSEIADKIRENPEIAHIKERLKDPMFQALNPRLTEKGIQRVLGDGVVAFHGGLDPKYIKGSKTYQRFSPGELLDYAKARPGRLASGVGLGLAGAALGGLAVSKLRNAFEPTLKEAEDYGGHEGFSTNQYSGVMNPPTLPYASGIPGWKEPPVKSVTKQETPDYTKESGAAGITPLGRLNSSKAIGAPRSTAAPGPSIAQIAKPKGFGLPMSGAKKGNNIV